VKKHFVFYPNFSHGDWHSEGGKLCGDVFQTGVARFDCWEVTYTISVEGCGLVTFGWRVDPSEDSWGYQGGTTTALDKYGTPLRIKDSKYPISAFYDEKGVMNPPWNLGKPLPKTCQYE
jgi:hypothetical protein